MIELPAHFGINFTPTYHTHAEGPTDPANIKLPNPFVVLITGAGKGLGWHITLAYAQAGASGLIISSRTKSDLDDLTAKIQSINPSCKVLARICDTTKNEDLVQLVKDVRQEFGRLDVAIANAGIISKYIDDASAPGGQRLPSGILEDDDFERVIDINLIGSYRVAKHFVPLLIETKDGPQSYVVITSLASHMPNSGLTTTAYNTSKIAVNRIAEHMDGDHRERDGVHAYAVHPGAVLTPQTQGHTGETWAQGNMQNLSFS